MTSRWPSRRYPRRSAAEHSRHQRGHPIRRELWEIAEPLTEAIHHSPGRPIRAPVSAVLLKLGEPPVGLCDPTQLTQPGLRWLMGSGPVRADVGPAGELTAGTVLKATQPRPFGNAELPGSIQVQTELLHHVLQSRVIPLEQC